jgi:hypothetical protein
VPPPPPPAKPGELRPFALRWSRVARTGDLETIALRLAWRDLAATVNVQIRPGASACRLVEADPSQRRALVAILTVALRDGAPA